MTTNRSARLARTALALVAVAGAAAGCATSSDAGTGATADAPVLATAAPAVRPAMAPNQMGITAAEQLPDSCALVPIETIAGLMPNVGEGTEEIGTEHDGSPLLYRACTYGDPIGGGAIGIQIGVANADGWDFVYNRSTVMDPALFSSVGEDGRGSMNIGILPSGGGRGSSLFFHLHGYSILVGHTGSGATLDSVGELADQVIATLGN